MAFGSMHILNVRKPNYDISPIADGFEALRKRKLQDEAADKERRIGERLAQGDMQGAEQEAYRLSDLSTGVSLRKQRLQEDENAYRRKQDEIEFADKRAKAGALQSDAAVKASEFERKRAANVLTTLDRASPDFRNQYATMVGKLKASGVNVPAEYDDPDVGYNIALAEVTSFKDRADFDKSRRSQSLSEQEFSLKRDESDRKAVSQRTRDFASLMRVMSNSTTPEQWQQNAQMINAVFGREVPFSEREGAIQKVQWAAQDSDKFAPTQEEQELGVTRDLKKEAATNEQLTKMFGDPGKGNTWAMGPDGKPYKRPSLTAAKEAEKSRQIVNYNVEKLKESEKTLLDANYFWRALSQATDTGGPAQASAEWENAVLGLVYERSGKQTAVAEMQQWLRTNGPKVGDSDWRIKRKMENVRQQYRALTGESLESEGGDANVRGMSDEELLRSLNQ